MVMASGADGLPARATRSCSNASCTPKCKIQGMMYMVAEAVGHLNVIIVGWKDTAPVEGP
jgi:hypothetical protein